MIDGEGCTLLPGLHRSARAPAHARPGAQGGLATGTAAAAAGGFCSVARDAQHRPGGRHAAGARLAARARRARCARARRVPRRDLGRAARRAARAARRARRRTAPAASPTTAGPCSPASLLRRALQYAATTGRVLSLHCEDTSLSRAARHARGRGLRAARPRRLPGDRRVDDDRPRPRASPATRAGRCTSATCTSRSRSSEVRLARSWGVDVSAEASPHHLLLTDEEVLTLDAARFKMSPPLAAEPHRQALVEGLRDGTVDCIATDHAPHHPAEKEVPFPAAPERRRSASRRPSRRSCTASSSPASSTLELIVERMTAGPARAFGLPRPRIAVGERGRPRALGPARALHRERGRPVLAQPQLRVPRPRGAGALPADARRRARRAPAVARGGGVSAVAPLPRGRHGLARRERRRARRGRRRGRVHDGHDGLPGGADRPELRAPDPHLHGADDRQLRGRGRRLRSRAASSRRR